MQQHDGVGVPIPSWYGREGFRVLAAEPNGIHGVFTHGGQLLQYNVFGHVFDVTAKYRPPVKPISRGAYGVVCSAFNVETNEEVAIKKIPNAFDNMIVAKRTLREIKILDHMDHENILAIREVLLPPEREDYKDVYIVTELMDADLHHIIKTSQELTEDHYQYFLYQLLRGLKYIHSANVLHRDLKPSNLLVSEDCDLKIADFGLARTFSESDLMTEYVVTRWYRSPELLLNARGYSAAVDMWSVGCILMELFNKEPLFPGKDYVHQFSSITELMGSPSDADLDYVRSENALRYLHQLPRHTKQPLAIRFPHLPPLAIDLIERMLTYNPAERITAEEALAHPYLSSLHDETDEPVCPRPFNFNMDEECLSEDDIRERIYQEAFIHSRRPPHHL
ncbi:hypothetical protein L7F22_014514 [Adiantum nelumboides]|nr:hypothetical protein [Adiantum nelumboides]